MSGHQYILSGVGGQGILFITRLLAETAIDLGLPVFTSETHGMAQRGGIVISHLKVGDFGSPMIRPGQADGLLSLKAETVALHRHFLKDSGWITANAKGQMGDALTVDADSIAVALGNPQAVNLVVLGKAFSLPARFFCEVSDLEKTMAGKLPGKKKLLEGALAAFRAGLES